MKGLDMSMDIKSSWGSGKYRLIFIFILSMILYANTLSNGFVYDDRYSIVQNSLIKSFKNIPLLFNPKEYFRESGELSWRPVVTLSYIMDYAVYGLAPWGYHLTNILINAVNSLIFYLLLILLYEKDGRTMEGWFADKKFVAALIFTVHPVLTEAVNAVSFREDLLCFMFYISAILLYLCGYMILCSVSFLIALLSKEMAVTLPLVLILIQWIWPERKNWKIISATLGSLCLYLILRFYLLYNPLEGAFSVWDWRERIVTLPYLLASYIKLLIFPVPLSVEHTIKSVKDINSITFFIFSTVLAWYLYLACSHRDKEVRFGLLFFLFALFPVLNIIPVANPFAERYLYIPVAGLCIAAGSMMAVHSAEKLLVPLIIVSFALLIVNRNGVWRDDYSLWSDAVSKSPGSSRPYNDLGNIMYEKRNYEEALKHYLTAAELKPDSLEAQNNLGNVYAVMGRLDEGMRHYLAALQINPMSSEVRVNLAGVYLRMGRNEDAKMELEMALKLRPGYPPALRLFKAIPRR